MSFRVRALTSPVMAQGFQLAGVPTDAVTSEDEAMTRLSQLAGQSDVGVVLMEQGLFDRIPAVLRRELARRPLPIVVPIPRPAREASVAAAEAYILELLRRAIGYRVRLR